MGQAVIGELHYSEEHPTAFRGRYVHWDGYPSHIGPQVAAMLGEHPDREVVQRLLRTLIRDNYAWSCLNAEQSAENSHRGAPVYSVAGVGEAYDDARSSEWIEGWLDGRLATWFAGNWAYLFDVVEARPELVIARIGPAGVRLTDRLTVGFLHLMTARDWKLIEQRGADCAR